MLYSSLASFPAHLGRGTPVKAPIVRERGEHDYKRHGTASPYAAFDITTFLALRNAQPTRYVWNAKGEDILNKIQRAREAMTSQAGG